MSSNDPEQPPDEERERERERDGDGLFSSTPPKKSTDGRREREEESLRDFNAISLRLKCLQKNRIITHWLFV